MAGTKRLNAQYRARFRALWSVVRNVPGNEALVREAWELVPPGRGVVWGNILVCKCGVFGPERTLLLVRCDYRGVLGVIVQPTVRWGQALEPFWEAVVTRWGALDEEGLAEARVWAARCLAGCRTANQEGRVTRKARKAQRRVLGRALALAIPPDPRGTVVDLP